MTQQTSDLSRGPAAGCPPIPGWRSRLIDVFGIDLRTLALLRVVVGSLVLLDLLFRTRDLKAFYTDWGVLPRAALIERFSPPSLVSIHLLSGQSWAIWVLFLIAAVLAVMMIAGYRSRLATALTWFMLLSLQNRNTMVNDGGDDVLRCLMFFLMFLPVGARFSIDALLTHGSPAPPKSNRYASVASAALLVQVFVIYYFTSMLKNHEIWWHGHAVSYALQLDIFATRLGNYMLNFPRLLVVLTYATLWTELVGPVLAFVPFFTGRVRLAVILIFISLHAGLGLCMALGIFPFICMAAWLAFLPGCFWDWLGGRVKLPEAAAWKAAVRKELRPRSLFPLPSGGGWVGGSANAPGQSAPLPASPQGEGEEKKPTAPLRVGPTWLGNTAAFCAIAFVLVWNARMVDPQRWGPCLPASVEEVGRVFRLDQNWSLFAPYPMIADGWYVMPATLVNGSEADVLTGGPVTWEKPPLVSATFPNSRWRKYMVNIWVNRENRSYVEAFAGFLCRRWDATHTGDLKMDTFRIFYMEEDSQLDASIPKPVPRMLWQHWCIKMPEHTAGVTTKPAATQPTPRPVGGQILPR